MTVDDFLAERPCLEELSGFIKGLPGTERVFTEAERQRLNDYRVALMKGKITPCVVSQDQAYIYRAGHAPTLKKGRKFR
jgi:hypothetical protein